MKLIINPREFKHLPDKSVYNYNFYEHITTGCVIIENCHEDFNYYSFFMVEGKEKIFIGCSNNGFGNEELIIDFKIEYT